jgi:5'-deoxynucleotidase YfbR-like HD superfamily hydrolase
VAEHSVRVSRVVPAEHALWGLLHDAGEAYLTDLPRPVKSQPEMAAFPQWEDKLLEVIMRHFRQSWPMPESVRQADEVLLMTEARDLMAPPPAPWSIIATPLPETITPMSPREAEQAFLRRFEQLSGCSVQ